MFGITEPRHGAVLNLHHGRSTDGGLEIVVEGSANLLNAVSVNGAPAARAGTRFSAPVFLREGETEITAVTQSPSGTRRHSIRVLWDRIPYQRYGFFIDDNSFFLTDIARNRYRSIFDCFYLKQLKELHDRYGTKFVLNLFYRNDHDKDRFTLAEFPDIYKCEWEDNAPWLRLSFHAYSEFPDRPYQYAPGETLANHYDLVRDQIVRFASERVFAPPSVIHWAMATSTGLQALAERGVKMLSGMFLNSRTAVGASADSRPDIGYSLDIERSEYLARHSVLYDFDYEIYFVRVDLCCNLDTKEALAKQLAARFAAKNPDFISMATHEQYSFPFYANYIPDHFDRMETAIRIVTERGYKPVFHHEGFSGSSACC